MVIEFFFNSNYPSLVNAEEAEPKSRALSQTDLATENDAYSDFEEVDFSEEDREVTGIEHNVPAADIEYRLDEVEELVNEVVDEVVSGDEERELDRLVADLVQQSLQKSVGEELLEQVASKLVKDVIQVK